MSLIIAEHVTHAYAEVEILHNVSFRVGESARIGVVGPNGEGKSTLLHIAAGLLEQTSGSVHRSRGLRISFLPQDPPALEGTTVHGAMLDVFAHVHRLEADLHALAERMSDDDSPELIERYGAMQAQLEAAGGYDVSTRIEQVLTGLAIPREMWDRALSTLSGGERTRAYLATLLLADPDVLLLDEPTNHLDMDSVEWLERWLASFRGALVVVSHDRYFLDRVTDQTWEVSATSLEAYRGAYSEYLPKREERRQERLSLWQSQQEHIRKTQEFIDRNLAGQRTKEAQGRRKRLERFLRDEAIPRPPSHRTIGLSLPAGRRTGDLVLRAENLTVGYDADTPLVAAEQLEVRRTQRIAIVGANGAGKTTLLRTLQLDLAPLAGTIRHGANVDISFLSQTHAELDAGATALQAVRAAGASDEQARSLLGALLLSGDDALKAIAELSGGQRSRIVLARLVAAGANVLMLDEPTNHLDIPSTEILQDVLRRFDGTVLFVSHDRYLVQAVATDIWAIEGGQVRIVRGGWENYLRWRDEQRGRSSSPARDDAKEQRKADYRSARKQTNQLQRLRRRHEQLEEQIETVEAELTSLQDDISTASESGDMAGIESLGQTYQQQDAHLKALWDEWEQVGEELE
jgi:ATP-binding cassette, subfamily F, member 3